MARVNLAELEEFNLTSTKPVVCQSCPYNKCIKLKNDGSDSPDILFLADYPREEDITRNKTFSSNAAKVFKTLLYQIAPRLDVNYGYVLPCWDQKIVPAVKDCLYCSSVLEDIIISLNPKLIVTMGKLATQALGLKVKNFNKTRGREISAYIGEKEFRVFPVHHPLAIYSEPGLTRVFKSDLLRAVTSSAKSSNERKELFLEKIKDYEYPVTVAAVKELTERIIAYKTDKWPIALDTETNTKYPHQPDAKCILFSVAWDYGKSAAIEMEHVQSVYPDFWWDCLPYIYNLLMCKKPKIAHNWIFDLRIFEFVLLNKLIRKYTEEPQYAVYFETECDYTIDEIIAARGLVNVKWDSMLGEHATDEDKKGNYSLKDITVLYSPEFYGYESTLRESTGEIKAWKEYYEDIKIERAEEITDSLTVRCWYSENCDKLGGMKPESVKFDLTANVQDFRKSIMVEKRRISGLLRRKATTEEDKKIYLKLAEWCSDAKDSIDFYVKDITAKYKKEAKELKKKLEREHSEGTYEDFPIAELKLYAAIDTDLTRKFAAIQMHKIREEEKANPSIDWKTAKVRTVYNTMEYQYIPGSKSLARMMHRGFAVDFEYLSYLDGQYQKQVINAEEEIFKRIGTDTYKGEKINLNANGQVIWIVQNLCGYELTEKTDKGNISLGKLVLEKMHKETEDDIFKHILDYRKSLSAKNTFVRNARTSAAMDGKIHCNFNLHGTATYRLSSSHPNF